MRASEKFNQTKNSTNPFSKHKNLISNLQLGLSQSFILPTRNGRNTKSTFHGCGILFIPSHHFLHHLLHAFVLNICNQNKANSVLASFSECKNPGLYSFIFHMWVESICHRSRVLQTHVWVNVGAKFQFDSACIWFSLVRFGFLVSGFGARGVQ